MSPRRTRKLMGEINVVPYIDVMLVLLIIFMVTAPLLSQGVKVELPETDGAEAIDPERSKRQKMPSNWMSFADGPHRCPGAQVAMHETRVFIERVLASYWIHRDRLGQPTPSLDAIAAGEWPTYTPLEQGSKAVAQNVSN